MPNKSSIYDTLFAEYDKQSKGDKSIEFAVKWFYREIRAIYSRTPVSLKEGMESQHKIAPEDIGFGRMYLFEYRAKKAEEYYDRYPVVLPFTVKSDHIVGFNLHYLPHRYRLIAMAAILAKADPRFPPTDKDITRFDYDTVRGRGAVEFMKVAVRQYRLRGIRSAVADISPQDWITAAFLPIAQFRGTLNTPTAISNEMTKQIRELRGD
jgi:hypothetical protein